MAETETKTKTKWQQKREASYEAVVRSAMHRFHDGGFAATRVEDIVKDTGYTAGAFYFHFANKTQCFFAVLDYRERLRGDWPQFVQGLDPAQTPLETVIRRGLEVLKDSLEGTSAWSLVMVDFFQQHRDDQAVLARLHEIYGRWQAELQQFVVALQRGGWVELARDPAVVTTEILAFFDGLITHAALFGLDGHVYETAQLEGLLRIIGPAQPATPPGGHR